MNMRHSLPPFKLPPFHQIITKEDYMKKGLFYLGMLASIELLAATYTLDITHTHVGFKVKHLKISTVKGNFNEFSGNIEFDDKNPKSLNASAIVQAKSINTNNEKRDEHLRGKDFFEVNKFPTIEFKSLKVKSFKNNKGVLEGTLTMRGVSKNIKLDFEYTGANSIWGKDKIGFTATGQINRKDFGLTWNSALETGGVLVGEEVDLVLEIEAEKPQATKESTK